MSLVLGIDTGGTYTDGVIMDLEKQKIITKAKALTTRENLTTGIRNCIKALNFEDYKAIKLVSLSTTLATNAIVEGRGSEVGLLLIGHEPIGKLPVQHWAVVKGGHDIKGKPQAELDLEAARKAIAGFKGKVGAVAISGYLSIRNPEHEIQLRELVGEILDVPVVCAHQLTTSLGFHERTVTAALNAKLIPIIAELLESVKKVLAELQLSAPIMIVKGDGSLMSDKLAREKPIDTILSGPAASIVGATFITETKEALVLDMGGTTTDIAILRDGMPKVNKEGAVVGGWLTRVQAAEINTYGLGGDSYVQIGKDRQLCFGPQRVWPLAVVAHEHPYLVDELRGLAENEEELLFAQPTDCFMLLKETVPGQLTETEKGALNILQTGPHSLFFLAQRLEKDPNLINLQNLVNLGTLAKVSVTPTDILHANGTYKQWNAAASTVGVQILARKIGRTFTEFLELAMEGIIRELALAIIQSIAGFEGSSLWIKDNAGARYFVDKILAPKEEDTMDCTARIKIPVVAIGAPVQAYLPQVAEKINAELIIPEHAEVANAIGAATGKVMETVRILIKPGSEGGFIIHAPWERKAYMHLEDAKIYALEQAKERAAAMAEKAGAADYQLMVNSEDVYSSTNTSWQDEVYLETRIEVTAIGRPRWDDEVA
ncbi:hydantoinase/oxoprolinase family protein [Zhaonella formicivorans]|uniref:hydantoinase/oxoprolinase family protein n=1 Tax=Zhaonella formicivorans TaxID=2528593 RepID=UPI0010DA10F1|nr:hydantoinase/oxoprolinase family protein [Zhaonella formicivorans]